MIFTLWKNLKKTQKQHPDYIVKDENFQDIGIAYNQISERTKSKYIKVNIKIA